MSGKRIIEGLEQILAWTRGDKEAAELVRVWTPKEIEGLRQQKREAIRLAREEIRARGTARLHPRIATARAAGKNV